MPNKHAILSASSAHRWLNCTPSARLNATYGSNTTSVYAEEGTLAHEFAEINLREFTGELTKEEAKFKRKCLKDNELFYIDMLDEVREYSDFCIECFNDMQNPHMAVEQRLDFSDYVPDGFGTGDCVLVDDTCIHIIDLKFGKGVAVSPVDNDQLMLYALGAYSWWGFIYSNIKKVKMSIAQVRLNNIETFEMPIDELIAWGESIKPTAKLAYHGKGKRQGGDWCKFCNLRYNCKARSDYIQGIIKTDELENAEIATILDKESEIKDWLNDIKQYALDTIMSGGEIPGYKVVEGTSRRKIIDNDGFLKALIDAGYEEKKIVKPKELYGITQLEKIIGKKKFAELSGDYVDKPAGKPTIVKDKDKRVAINSVENEFEFN